MTASGTKERILAIARATVQNRGYAGLSFRDLAKNVGIKSASIHYHFQSKADLGAALVNQYTAELAARLESIFRENLDADVCMKKYASIFRNTLKNDNRLCLGGMLAAERTELPPAVQAEVVRFSEMNVEWLVRVLVRAERPGRPALKETRNRAVAIFAGIQGAQLVARSRHNISVYDCCIASFRQSGMLP